VLSATCFEGTSENRTDNHFRAWGSLVRHMHIFGIVICRSLRYVELTQ
jgi:hypothetical protein